MSDAPEDSGEGPRAPDVEGAGRGRLRDRDPVILIDRKERAYLRTLKRGGRIAVRGMPIPADLLIGREEGTTVEMPSGERLLVLRPSYAQLIPNLPRAAQPIFPKDVGPLLLWTDVRPGQTVVEVGTGPGATTLALLRAVGPAGRLVSYELREEFAARARDNVARFHGPATNWTVRIGDAFAGLAERDVDAVIVDLAEPWHLLPSVADALRAGGALAAFLPTVLQVKQLVDALHAAGSFGAVESLETLLRHWHVGPRSLRPSHRMVAHTGFLVFARRLAREPLVRSELTPSTPYSSGIPLGDSPGSTHDDEGGDPPEGLEDD